MKNQVNQLEKEKEQNRQTITNLREICVMNSNKVEEIKEKVSSTLDVLNSNNPYNPFKWILESQSSTIEDLIQHNKELQEKINNFLSTYNRFQTMESLGSVTESDSNSQDSQQNSGSKPVVTDGNQDYENLLSPEQQQQETPQDNESKTDDMSPTPKLKLIKFESSQNSFSDGEMKKRKNYLSRSEMKERLSPEIQTGATSLAIKHKEFTFKKDESENKLPKTLNLNTQEFSVKNKSSFERGEGFSRSVSSNQASDRKQGRDNNFQNISLLSKSTKEVKILKQSHGETECNNIEGQIKDPEMLNPNCSVCISNENKYEQGEQDFYPEDEYLGNRLQTEPVPLTDNSRGFHYTNMSCYSPITSEINENHPQYFKDKIKDYSRRKSKIGQYPTLKEKIFEITGKIPKPINCKMISTNKPKASKNKKEVYEVQKPFPLTPESICKIPNDTLSSLGNPLTSKSQKASVDYTKIFRKASNYITKGNGKNINEKPNEGENLEDKKVEVMEKPNLAALVQRTQQKSKSSSNLGYFRNSFGKAKSFLTVPDDF